MGVIGYVNLIVKGYKTEMADLAINGQDNN